jgi:hypothetical protein
VIGLVSFVVVGYFVEYVLMVVDLEIILAAGYFVVIVQKAVDFVKIIVVY